MTTEPARARPVGWFELLALGINGIVGVGIFFAPSDIAAGAPGWSSVAVLAVTGALLSPVALAFAVVGRRFDEDGGPVVFARAAFGPGISFLVGWVAYVSAIASTAAIVAGLTASVAPLLGLQTPAALKVAASAVVTALALLAALGIAFTARAWTALTILKLVPLVALVAAYTLAGVPSVAVPAVPPTHSEGSLLRAALTAVFAFQGFEIVPVVAGQVRAPARAVPLATLGSLGAAGALYLGLQSACVAALPALASSPAPLVEAAGVYGGPGLARIVRAGTSVSALGIAVGMVATTPRYLSALARGGALGFGLERVAPNGVPLRALFTTWVLVLALVQAGTRGQLFALSSVAVLMQYVVTGLALAALARRGERGLRPSQAWIAVPAVIVATFLTAGAQEREWAVAGVAILLGVGLRAAARRFARARKGPRSGGAARTRLPAGGPPGPEPR